MQQHLKLGVLATTRKANEKRLPIHPDHLGLLPEALRKSLILEKGYGKAFGLSDGEMRKRCGGFMPREQMLQELPALLILKPEAEELRSLPENTVVWGWPHCVQQTAIAQAAIDRHLTLIAFEAMFARGPAGDMGLHTFYKNNEIAGYAAVQHALSLKGLAGAYGKALKVVILGAGSVSRGAIKALQGRGLTDITVCRMRPPHLYREEEQGCTYLALVPDRRRPGYWCTQASMGQPKPVIKLLAEADIIVNAVFQNPNEPAIFVHPEDFDELKAQTLILDVSCDARMAFAGARPTSFDEPLIQLQGLDYYAVDHTPSYFWQSATWEISQALLPFVETLIKGPKAWQANAVMRSAIEIQNGIVQNPAILAFQNRQAEYPHAQN